MHLNKVGNGKEFRLQRRRICFLVKCMDALCGWRDVRRTARTSRMTYLAVFLCAIEKGRPVGTPLQIPKRQKRFRNPLYPAHGERG